MLCKKFHNPVKGQQGHAFVYRFYRGGRFPCEIHYSGIINSNGGVLVRPRLGISGGSLATRQHGLMVHGRQAVKSPCKYKQVAVMAIPAFHGVYCRYGQLCKSLHIVKPDIFYNLLRHALSLRKSGTQLLYVRPVYPILLCKICRTRIF